MTEGKQLKIYLYDTVRHNVIEEHVMTAAPRTGEYVLLRDGRAMVVTRVVHDLQDGLIRIYLDRGGL